MLGYIQGEDFDYWQKEINGWIDNLIGDANQNSKWEAQDKLSKINTATLGEYDSKHSRKAKGPITLYHFWLNFCN